MMKKNVTAEGEELGINERLISSELGVLDFYITPFVSLHFLSCNFLTLEKKLKVLGHSVEGTTNLSLIFRPGIIFYIYSSTKPPAKFLKHHDS